MKYSTLFLNTSSADGFKIVNIPWVSYEKITRKILLCKQTGKELKVINDNIEIIDTLPPDNEIWYHGAYYDLESAISVLEQQAPYKGPAILSNKQVGDKYVITFDGPVTELGVNTEPNEVYPIFMNNLEMGITCNITGIEIPNSVTSIGIYAFADFDNCASLTSVVIHNNITNIGGGAFYGCSGLTFIEIPNSVTSIGGEAFEDCTGLTSVKIGNSVISIGDWAFSGCSGLTSITCEAITPPTLSSNSTFKDTNCLIYVPVGSVDAYKAAEYWSEYASRIYAIPE